MASSGSSARPVGQQLPVSYVLILGASTTCRDTGQPWRSAGASSALDGPASCARLSQPGARHRSERSIVGRQETRAAPLGHFLCQAARTGALMISPAGAFLSTLPCRARAVAGPSPRPSKASPARARAPPPQISASLPATRNSQLATSTPSLAHVASRRRNDRLPSAATRPAPWLLHPSSFLTSCCKARRPALCRPSARNPSRLRRRAGSAGSLFVHTYIASHRPPALECAPRCHHGPTTAARVPSGHLRRPGLRQRRRKR